MNAVDYPEMIGKSDEFQHAKRLIRRYAGIEATVLILGESGTGKELAAREIHRLSRRCNQPFTAVNCGAVPDHLVESEYFGHVKGAFTDAKEARQGLVASTRGGSLFLDEIEAMPLRSQGALLRFLQDKEFRAVGGEAVKTADVRLIAASNVDLFAMAKAGLFREDLLYRLNVLALNLPPLRQRREDIPLLVQKFLDRLNAEHEGAPKFLHPDAWAALNDYGWPGNIRELEHLIFRAFMTAEGSAIVVALPQHLPGDSKASTFANIKHDSLDKNNPHDQQILRNRRASDRQLSQSPSPNGLDWSTLLPGDGIWNKPTPRKVQTYEEYRKFRDELITHIDLTYLKDLLEKAGGNLSMAARIADKDRSNLTKLLMKHGLVNRGSVSGLGDQGLPE